MKRRTYWRAAVLGFYMATALLGPAMVLGQTAELQGTVKRVTPQKGRLSVIDAADKVWSFVVDPKARVRVSGEEAKLDELAEGWKVVVHYEKGDDLPIATTIEATPVFFRREDSETTETAVVRINPPVDAPIARMR